MAAEDKWRSHIEQWGASGLTAKAYGAREGINPGTLTYWKWRLGRGQRELQGPTAELSNFVEIRTVSDAGFEVEVARGRRVRVPSSFDAVSLRRLLDVLEGAS